ncbi:MAG: hypothetical protein HC912_12210 [Saprospiraceae bacterium]|nr:hypothetical protein [Saprospiraceae bacterium]
MKMEEKHLDKLVEGKLKDLELPYLSDTWSILENKIERDEKVFDDTVKNKVQRFEPSYQPWYWSLLATKLDEEAALRKQLIQYKSIELFLVLLLIFTGFHCLPTAYEKIKPIQKQKKIKICLYAFSNNR